MSSWFDIVSGEHGLTEDGKTVAHIISKAQRPVHCKHSIVTCLHQTSLALPWKIFAARDESNDSDNEKSSITSSTSETSKGSNPIEAPSQNRFVFVDGLRGLAALGIVIFHIWWYEPEPWPALESAHWIVDAAFYRIRVSVQILLVISGFVIAYTMRNTWVTPRELISFIGRRLVRLVPPYWVAIGVVILVDLFGRGYWGLSSPFDGELSIFRVSAHLAFLQDAIGFEALGAGMWTICIEMQFYIVAILGWGLAQRLFPRPIPNEPRPSVAGILVVFAPVAFVSLFYWRQLESTSPWVIHFGWMFFLGMVTWWTLDRTLPVSCYAAIAVIAAVELVFDVEWRNENAVTLATSLAIFIAGRRNRLHQWLNWPWLQYLGRISYSLYLIHFPVCHLLTSAGWKWYSKTPTAIQAGTLLVASLFASLCAAHVLYVYVEAPSARLSGKLKRLTA